MPTGIERMLMLANKDIGVVNTHPIYNSGVFPTEESHVRETAYKYCREFLPGAWRSIQLSDMVISKISGGLSNLLYCCRVADYVPLVHDEPRQVLVRFYGQVNRSRALETLITECVILTMLSERQRGPQLYGVFPGGRIEEYVDARPLLTKELAHPNISCRIAEKVATIHMMDVPMNKSPSHMWEYADRWLGTIDNLINQDSANHDPTEQAMIQQLRSLDISNELTWLRKFLKNVSSPVVFCHNDMQEGNILLRLSDIDPDTITADDLVVIDFEYCSYNWRGYDLANHFNEWMYDYKNDSLPYFWERPIEDWATSQQKELFVSAYLKRLMESPSYRKRAEDTVEHILKEIEFYTLASHFFWALWSVVSNSDLFNRSIQFDYWCYGEKRFEAYFKQKRKLLLDTSL